MEYDKNKQLNEVYYVYKQELVRELKVWSSIYEEGNTTRIYKNLQTAINEISSLQGPGEDTWQSFWDSAPIEKGTSLVISITLEAAKKGLLGEAAKALVSKATGAIPVVRQALFIVDNIHNVASLVDVDLSAALQGEEIAQACFKYYKDLYWHVAMSYSDIDKHNAAEFCTKLELCLAWQNVIFLSYGQNFTSLTASGLFGEIIDACVNGTLDVEINKMQSVVNKYVSLVEECFNVQR